MAGQVETCDEWRGRMQSYVPPPGFEIDWPANIEQFCMLQPGHVMMFVMIRLFFLRPLLTRGPKCPIYET